jgi:hypothetical protein
MTDNSISTQSSPHIDFFYSIIILPNFYIFSESGIEFFVGHKELQDLAYDSQTKGIFENIIRPNNLVTIEPYRDYGYYNQQRSLVESFDFLINEIADCAFAFAILNYFTLTIKFTNCYNFVL